MPGWKHCRRRNLDSVTREETGDVLALLRRWEASGATWRVDAITADAVHVALHACTGEEIDRFVVRGAAAQDVLAEDADVH